MPLPLRLVRVGLLGLLAATFHLTASAQCTGIVVEVDTAFYAPAPLPGSMPGTAAYTFDAEGYLEGYVSYSVFATFTNPTDVLSSIYAVNGGPSMFIDAPCGCFNQLQFTDVMLGGAQNQAFFFLEPEGRYDTYWTIGRTPGEYSLFGILNPAGLYNSNTICSTDVVDGSIFLTYTSCANVAAQCIAGCGGNPTCIANCNAAQATCQANLPNLSNAAGSDLKILIARVTTCGDFSFSACMQTFVQGNQTNIDTWCAPTDGGGVVQVENPCADYAATNAPVTVVTPLNCAGETATVSVPGAVAPATYTLWQSTETDPVVVATQSNPVFSGIGEGNYFITIFDGNTCRDTTGQFGFVEPEPFAVDWTLLENNTCPGVIDNAVQVVATGGVTPYDFGASLTSGGTVFDPNGSGVWSNLPCAGQNGGYTFTAVDANGCDASEVIALNCPAPLVLNLSSDDITCYGAGNGEITGVATGGTGTLTVSATPGPVTAAGASPLQVNFTGLEEGNYVVTLQDANGCTTTGNYGIDEPAEVGISIAATDILCAGECTGTAVLTANGGSPPFDYLVTTPGGQTVNANALCAGSYVANAIDANNCVISGTFSVAEPAPIVFEVVVEDVSCAGEADGSLCIVDAAGGTGDLVYQVLPIPGNYSSTTCFDLPIGTYTVNVRDENLCVETVTGLTLIEPAPIQLLVNTQHISCTSFADGEVTVSAIGGTGDIALVLPFPSGLPATVDDLDAGPVLIAVEDESGCVVEQSVVILEPDTLIVEIDAVTNVVCGGDCDGTAEIAFFGGSGGLTLELNGSTNFDLDALCAAEYEAAVQDANGCVSAVDFTVEEPEPIEVLFAVDPVTCTGMNDGSAVIFPTGGTGGVTWQLLEPGIDLDNLYEGVYHVLAVDQTGCTEEAEFEVVAEEVTDMEVETLSSPTTCWERNDGTATASVTGGYTPISYAWSDSKAQTTATATGLAEDTYVVVVTDSLGCRLEFTVTVEPTVGCLFIAEAITPNGDGYNDEWVVGGLEYFPNSQVTVFNRWGQVLFESRGYTQRWDGRTNGFELPVADYYYVIDLADGNAPITGTVTLKY
jgi:gliding motility-associated-like protein